MDVVTHETKLQTSFADPDHSADKRWRAYFRYSSDLLGTLTLDGTWSTINPALEALLGIPAERAGTATFFDSVAAEDRGFAMETLSRLSGKQPSARFVARMTAADGAQHLVDWTVVKVVESGLIHLTGRFTPLVADAGSDVEDEDLNSQIEDRTADLNMAVMFLVEVIQEMDQVEAALRQRETVFRFLFATNTHPMWVVDLETYEFLAANDAAIADLGYSQDALLKMRVTDVAALRHIGRLLMRLNEQLAQEADQAGLTLAEMGMTTHVLEYEGRRAALIVA